MIVHNKTIYIKYRIVSTV